MDLPIDLKSPYLNPPVFRWRQVTTTPVGDAVVQHEGMLPPSVEGAVAALITLVKEQAKDIEALRAAKRRLEAALPPQQGSSVKKGGRAG